MVGPAWLQGISPGRVELVARGTGTPMRVDIDVSGIDMRDGEGDVVDMARSHASLERTPPERIEGPVDARYDDVDALRDAFGSDLSVRVRDDGEWAAFLVGPQ